MYTQANLQKIVIKIIRYAGSYFTVVKLSSSMQFTQSVDPVQFNVV